ncbi:MAG: hypothetical protein GX347_08560 [Epulopiscium sp.]|nr:hypothetical protein [Candidatus Epulonipiscium sp.]
MEVIFNNGFYEMSEEEMQTIDGGLGFVAGTIIGAGAAWVVDGAVEAFTGKSIGGWVATGINKVRGK